MRILRRRMLLGLGALIGCCVTGCQNGFIASRVDSMRTAVAVRRTSGPAAELLPPRVSATAVASTSYRPPSSPIVRTSAEEMPGGAVVASSWRPLPRTDLEGPSLAEVSPEPRTLAAPGVEKLPPPRMAATHAVGPHVMGGSAHGEVVMGPHGEPVSVMHHHAVHVGAGDVPRERAKAALPTYVIEPPDLILVQFLRDPKLVPQPVDGQFLVRPDGTITLGVYGTVKVAGLTLDEAKDAIISVLRTRVQPIQEIDDQGKPKVDKDGKPVYLDMRNEVVVDVLEFASKYCYVIADGAGFGATVVRIPINGSDTVLDVFGKVGGLPAQSAKKKIWVARPATGQQLPVDWESVAMRGDPYTNYQVFPGDRIFVHSDALLRFDTAVGKFVNPAERLLGATLLGSVTVNSIKRGNR